MYLARAFLLIVTLAAPLTVSANAAAIHHYSQSQYGYHYKPACSEELANALSMLRATFPNDEVKVTKNRTLLVNKDGEFYYCKRNGVAAKGKCRDPDAAIGPLYDPTPLSSNKRVKAAHSNRHCEFNILILYKENAEPTSMESLSK